MRKRSSNKCGRNQLASWPDRGVQGVDHPDSAATGECAPDQMNPAGLRRRVETHMYVQAPLPADCP